MADHTITADQFGAYEFDLPAGADVTVDVENRYRIEVIQHSGSSPVYVMTADLPATPRDPFARIVMPLSSLTVTNEDSFDSSVIHLVSASDAVVSVARR